MSWITKNENILTVVLNYYESPVWKHDTTTVWGSEQGLNTIPLTKRECDNSTKSKTNCISLTKKMNHY